MAKNETEIKQNVDVLVHKTIFASTLGSMIEQNVHLVSLLEMLRQGFKLGTLGKIGCF